MGWPYKASFLEAMQLVLALLESILQYVGFYSLAISHLLVPEVFGIANNICPAC